MYITVRILRYSEYFPSIPLAKHNRYFFLHNYTFASHLYMSHIQNMIFSKVVASVFKTFYVYETVWKKNDGLSGKTQIQTVIKLF